MIHFPRTLNQARKKRYGAWAGKPDGNAFVPERCAYDVYPSKDFISRQCYRNSGFGINYLYCRQHAQIVERDIKEDDKKHQAEKGEV